MFKHKMTWRLANANGNLSVLILSANFMDWGTPVFCLATFLGCLTHVTIAFRSWGYPDATLYDPLTCNQDISLKISLEGTHTFLFHDVTGTGGLS